jgi:hypothetical protein
LRAAVRQAAARFIEREFMNDYRSNNILPAWYEVIITTGVSVNATATLVLEQASEFELHQIFGSSDQDAAGNFMPNNFSLQITDQSTGRQFMNARVPQRNICAPSNGGYRLIRPVIFPPLCNLLFDALDLSAHANVITITLAGYKIYGNVQ